MTANFASMVYGFVSSPSQSPNQLHFTHAQYFDSTSESSSPSSPRHMSQVMFNPSPMQYDVFQYSNNSQSFYTPQSTRIPVEYTGSSTLDERDRRRRRSGNTSTSSKDKESIPNMHLRRRAQNRASQRAFRERKEKHVKGLEHQLDDLREKHQDLLQSYTRQANEVTKLTTRIAELNAELDSLRSCADQSFSDLMMPEKFAKFDKFDAFSGHDMLYNGPECYFDKSAVNLNSEFALHSFEDSL